MTKQYQELRDYLFKVLQDAGFKPMLPDGGYFIICDASGLFENGDEDLSKHILVNVGVTGIPLHPFYQNKTSNISNLIRFAFCKEMSLLKEAAKRFQAKSGQ
jgi:aspartate/methionine/tyrosine aminotransferase